MKTACRSAMRDTPESLSHGVLEAVDHFDASVWFRSGRHGDPVIGGACMPGAIGSERL